MCEIGERKRLPTPTPPTGFPRGADPPPFSAFDSAVSTISRVGRKFPRRILTGHSMILRMRSTPKKLIEKLIIM